VAARVIDGAAQGLDDDAVLFTGEIKGLPGSAGPETNLGLPSRWPSSGIPMMADISGAGRRAKKPRALRTIFCKQRRG
jgi:hypothetical protein